MAGVAVRSGARARGNKLIWFLAIALGVLTAVLLVTYLRQKEQEQRVRAEASVPVVVAKKDIPLGVTITSDMLEVKHVTPELTVRNAFDESARVIGLRARSAIPAGAQLVPSMVVQAGAADALSFVVPPGKRAFAISANDVVGSGGHIRPGDIVDVVVTIESWKLTGGTPPSGEKPVSTYTILQNIEVLAVADEVQKISATGPEDKDKDKKPEQRLTVGGNKTITLAVDPKQAQVLFWAESEGKIRLALRPFGDRDEQPLTPVMAPVLGQAGSR